jgi:hypothetical protein
LKKISGDMNRFQAADAVTEILLNLSDIGEVEDVLAMVNAIFPKGKTGKPGKKSEPNEKKSSKKKKTSTTEGSEESSIPPHKLVVNILSDVESEFEQLAASLPDVSRQEGAMHPGLGRAQVQKRLKVKNRELRKVLNNLSKASDKESTDLLAYESLNKIQAFRIAAVDASSTEGTRIVNTPLPENFSDLIPLLLEVAEERKSSQEVLSTGFFSNKDLKYGGIKIGESPSGGLIEENNSQSDTDT